MHEKELKNTRKYAYDYELRYGYLIYKNSETQFT